MLVFKILVGVAILLCVANFAFTIHMLLEANRLLNSVKNWAVEIDKSNLNYIRQEFAKLKIENNLIINQEEDGNDVTLNEVDEEK